MGACLCVFKKQINYAIGSHMLILIIFFDILFFCHCHLRKKQTTLATCKIVFYRIIINFRP